MLQATSGTGWVPLRSENYCSALPVLKLAAGASSRHPHRHPLLLPLRACLLLLQGVDTSAYAHEAGYDAYMTGAAFACLLRLYEAADAGASADDAQPVSWQRRRQPSLAAVAERCWRINLSRSDMLYAALQGPDPIPDRAHVYHLTGWQEGGQRVYPNDIARWVRYGGTAGGAVRPGRGGSAVRRYGLWRADAHRRCSRAGLAVLPSCGRNLCLSAFPYTHQASNPPNCLPAGA